MQVPEKAQISFDQDAAGTLVVRLAGSWRAVDHVPQASEVAERVRADATIRRIVFDTSSLTAWDTGILPFLLGTVALTASGEVTVGLAGTPAGIQRLLRLATAVPERKGARQSAAAPSLLTQIGSESLKLWRQMGAMIGFLGEAVIGLGRFARGRARYRRSDLWYLIQECGAQALPIVSLISFLLGLILAFVGAVQLQMFGAQIFVADLVAIAMAREMGAVMTGIIMSGRTGASFAAQIGTMEVNEEIDALKTFGFSPIDFLVTPRIIALVIMMPLLCLYADLVGIIGGALVGTAMLDIPLTQYINETRAAVDLTDFAIGVFKSAVFGVLIALAGCMQGMRCGRSASAVGAAATSAVVTAIVAIIVADGAFAVITSILGI
jgi:phospholipid/cholesterol/gamma-HCH transport system permease protein